VAILSGGVSVDWVHAVYVVAFEQAVENVRPALPDRGLFAFWN
jgi:hypothetical protein